MRIRKTTPGLNRRRFLVASAAGLGAAGLTATGAAAADASPASSGQPGSSLAEAVLAAFRTHRLVAIGKAHAAQETADLLLTLLSGTAYWAELQRRNTIQGGGVDLDAFRQQRPPAYPLAPAGPAC